MTPITERLAEALKLIITSSGMTYIKSTARIAIAEYDRLRTAEGGEGRERTGGCALIAVERNRQISSEGWSAAHDDAHTDEELAIAAAIYAAPGYERSNKPRIRGAIIQFWPWDISWWKPCRENRIRELVKAGALIAAEIDRLLRTFDKTAAPPPQPVAPERGEAKAVASVSRKGFQIGGLVWTAHGERADLPDGTFLYATPQPPPAPGRAKDLLPCPNGHDGAPDDSELAKSVARIVGPSSAAQAALNRQEELANTGFAAKIFADKGMWLVTEPPK